MPGLDPGIHREMKGRAARPFLARLAVNEAELRAYGLVAQAIVRHAFAKASSETNRDRGLYSSRFPGAPQPIYFHEYVSTFESVADDLCRLGILKPVDQRQIAYFVFDCEVSEANIVAERSWEQGPSLFDLLVTFVNLFGEFGTEYWGFSSSRGVPFGANGRLASAFDALATVGYLGKTDDGYVWTGLIAPVMQASYEFEGWSDQPVGRISEA
jgi:hypothetical protein